jgi:hypothetical protein
MSKMYVIVSLKHSEKNECTFWRPDNAGYTTNPWAAGFYTEEQVTKDPDYYNDGFNAVAVCINNSSLPDSGIAIHLSFSKMHAYRKNNKAQLITKLHESRT